MKKTIYPASLPMLTLGAGILGMLLRFWLMASVTEENLLKQGHPASVLVGILSLTVVVFLFLNTRRFKGQGKYRINFPPSLPAALCCVFAGTLLFLRGMTLLLDNQSALYTAAGISCVVAAPCMVITGINRRKGQRSTFLLHVVVCLCFAFQLMFHYQSWTGSPVLQFHFYRLLSTTGLMLTFYHRAEFDARIGNRRRYAFANLCTMFFCLLAIPEGDSLFYLSMAAWLLTNQCALVLPRRRAPKNKEAEPQDTPPAEQPGDAPAADLQPEEKLPEAETPAGSGQEEA